jgi:hypothetical protein
MRGIAGFTLLFVVLVALPGDANAQADEEGASAGPTTQEPLSEPAPEEPALQLQLDDAGVGLTPSPPRTPDGYTLEEAELRAKGAKLGLGLSVIPFVIGATLLGVSSLEFWGEPMFGPGMAIGGGVLMGAGVAGLVGFGVMLGKRNSDLESLKSQQRRAQWDLATSRLVF